MSVDQQSQEAFETWFREGVGDADVRLQISARYPDQYTDSVVDGMWDGWQGCWNRRSATTRAEALEEAEPIMGLADTWVVASIHKALAVNTGRTTTADPIAAREALRIALIRALGSSGGTKEGR